MEIAAILVREVAVMFLFISVGMLCRVKGILDDNSARALSNVVLMVVTPALMIANQQIDLVYELLPATGLAIAASGLYHFLGAQVANRVVHDPGDGSTAWRVTKLAINFPNAGFMGFPLLAATIGGNGLLYGVMFVSIFNVANWFWSVPTLTGKKGPSLLQLLTTPAVAASLGGLALYLLQIRLPYVLLTVASQLGQLNTPMSMMVIGVFLATVNVREAVRDPWVYRTVLLRNILLPLAMLLLLWATRVSIWLPGGREFALSILIMIGCPSAAVAILMPSCYGCDSAHGSKLVAVSTALSIVTLPLLVMLANHLL